MAKSPIKYEDHFFLQDPDFQKILDVALSRGGDFAEIYLEHRAFSHINMEEDIIKETSESISLGLGVRVNSGDKTGYAYTNDISMEKIKQTALTAASISSERTAKNSAALLHTAPSHNFYPLLDPAHKRSLQDKISLVRRTYDAAQKLDPKIKKVKASIIDQIQHVRIINSEGLSVAEGRPLIKLACFAVAEESSKREAGYCGGGGRVGLEYFKNVYTPEQIGQDAAEEPQLPVLLAHPRSPLRG